MSNQYPPVQFLSGTKAAIFSCPLDPNLIRTGTLNEGSSFLHAILTSYSSRYRQMGDKEKKEYAKNLRNKLGKKLSKFTWMKYGDPEIIIDSLITKIKKIILEIYRYVSDPAKFLNLNHASEIVNSKFFYKNQKTFKIIMEQIYPFKILEQQGLSSALDLCHLEYKKSAGDETVVETLEIYKEIINENLGASFRLFFNEKFGNEVTNSVFEEYFVRFNSLMENIINLSEEILFSRFREKLINPNTLVDQFLIGYLSDIFNRDIYFINSKTRMPAHLGPCETKKRKSIIILHFNNDHYETLGVFNKETKKALREFDFDHELVQKIYNVLYNIRKVNKNYPDLIPFIPKQMKRLRKLEEMETMETDYICNDDSYEESDDDNKSSNSSDEERNNDEDEKTSEDSDGDTEEDDSDGSDYDVSDGEGDDNDNREGN
jgi:hypothetical protein